ncbi:hypothetical protein KJ671_01030 [Patescibacteria group bacterium]|nr:hypothetical protein [Patescibacteria group bacterium]
MPKNSHLHVVLETDFLLMLKKEAKERSISVSELCRIKLQKTLQLDRIEFIVKKILEKNEGKNKI